MRRVCRVLLDTQALLVGVHTVRSLDRESALEKLRVEAVHATIKVLDINYCLTRIGTISLVEQVSATTAILVA
jgi:hypothetical protein